MKVFHYKNGSVSGKTMTVAEIKEKLNEFPDDMPVFGGYETVLGYIDHDGFSIEEVAKGGVIESCDALIIDVEKY